MPPKRKVPTGSNGGAKRSRADTPADTISSGDEYSDLSESEEEYMQSIEHVTDKFALDRSSGRTAPRANDAVSGIFKKKDFNWLHIKPDHDSRPLWIDPELGVIVLESFSPLAAQAQDFLTTVAEPQSRPIFMHEYKLTPHSLYAAVSVGLDPNDIISVLDRLSKVPLSEKLLNWITTCTNSYGKVKLVLRDNRYFVETREPAVLHKLLSDPVIGPLRVQGGELTKERAPQMGGLVIPGTKEAAGAKQVAGQPQAADGPAPGQGATGQESAQDIYTSVTGIKEDEEGDDEENDVVHSFEVLGINVETVTKQCIELGYPTLEEYDFRNDSRNANLDIDLRPQARIRPYQEKSLSKMFGNGRAKSGIIVLPCGAGKTLVGITAACTIKKSVLVLATSSMSVVQWRQQFIQWSDIDPDQIAIFTSDSKDKFRGDAGIVVSTYSMVTTSGKRSYDSQKMMEFLQSREWGLIILDEVHVVPADMFRKVATLIATHTKLGLTATLLREDDKISDLNFLIGPKLYEANWMELAEQGHIAKVQCAEVWCPMTPEFYTEYLRESDVRKRTLHYVMNPKKFQACQFLIDYHEKRGDKIIVFSDNVFALQTYALKLKKAYIYGATPHQERLRILENFQLNDQVNTIFLSKIGDTSLDLPEATCLIQIASQYGSRRQEAQRLGRILRAKRRNDEGFNAFFYSLVSKDTIEMLYSSKRQAFLVDQGYAFKVITELQGMDDLPNLAFSTLQERKELLEQVMLQNSEAGEAEKEDKNFDGAKLSWNRSRKRLNHKRTTGKLSELAGGESMAYVEYNTSRNKDLKQAKGGKSAFFKKLHREQEKKRKEFAKNDE